MKKYSKLMAVLLVVAMLLPGIAQAAPAVTKEDVHYVTVIDLNLRTRNDDTASPVVFVPEGEKVLFTGEKTDNGYFSLEYNGKEGYAHRGDVTSEENYNSNDKTIHDIKLNEKSNGKSYRVVQNISLRTGNGKQYRSVELMVRDGVVKHLGTTENGWFKVNYDGQDGYVYRGDVTGLDNSGSDEIHDIELVEKANNKTYVAIVDLALRTGNGKQYKAIGLVERGQEVTHLGATANGWFKVDANGTVGYVYRGDLTSRANYDDLHEEVELEVESVKVIDEVTLEVELTDGTVHTVTLETALKDNVKTEVTFEIDGNEYTATVTYVAKGLKVESVSAINGTLEVKMNDKLEATAISSDFKIVQKINETTKAISASSVSYDEETKTVKLAVPTISSTEQNQTVSYTVGYKETAVVNSNSFVIPKVGELGVDSVTAMSSTQIKVVFNQEVNATSAAKAPAALAKYKLGTADKDGKIENEAVLPPGTNLSLQSDNKTLIITLADATAIANVLTTNGQLDNNTGYILEVSKDILPVSGKAPTKDIEVPFILKDNVAPKISSISINEQEELEIVFDEKLLDTQDVDVTINGHTESVAPAYVQVIGASEVTIDKADLVDSAKFNLTAGKTYNIVVSKGEDAYGKEMKIHRSKFTYTSAAEAPSVKSVKAIDESTFLIEFSEPVKQLDGSDFESNNDWVQVSKGAKQYTATVITPSTTVANAYEVTFSPADIAANDAIYDRYKNETSIELDVYIKDIKDLAGNITPASRHSVMLKKDTARPTVVKTINKNDGVVELTFNKDLDLNTVDADFVAAKAYVLKSNGVKENIADTNVTVNGRVVEFDFASLNLPDGNYTLVLEEGAVIDNTLNGGNKNSEIQVPFVSTDDGLDGKPEVDATIDADTTPGVIEITFDQKISYESAAKSSNYVIDGKAIPAASKFELDALTGTVLSITLPEGTYKKTEDLDMVINGVRNLAGTLMDEHEEVVTVAENEEIKLQSAKVVNGELILTFNENVNAADIGAKAFDETHFIVKANGVDVDIASAMDYTTVKAANDEEVFTKNQLKLKADTGFSLATGTITVKLDGTAITTDNIVDAAGNKVQLDGKIHTATR